jgi:hypothetical protein
MTSARFRVAQGVVVEEMGNELVVMVPGSTQVLSLTGAAAETVRKSRSGEIVLVNAVTDELASAGVLESSAFSRRALIKAGAIGAGAGIAVLALPAAAAASSGPNGGTDGYEPPPGVQVLNASNEWGRRTDMGIYSSVADGTNYFFGFYLNNSFQTAQARPTLYFAGFEDEVSAIDNSSDPNWESWAEFFPAISSLSSALQQFLLNEQGSIPRVSGEKLPDDFLYVEWGGTTYAVNDVAWY